MPSRYKQVKIAPAPATISKHTLLATTNNNVTTGGVLAAGQQVPAAGQQVPAAGQQVPAAGASSLSGVTVASAARTVTAQNTFLAQLLKGQGQYTVRVLWHVLM